MTSENRKLILSDYSDSSLNDSALKSSNKKQKMPASNEKIVHKNMQ